jgi:N-acetylmuramoyl-L-alanine amidase
MPSFGRFPAAIACICIAATGSAQGSNAAALFREAVARETALRHQIDTRGAGTPATPLLERSRILVGAYEDIARLFPSSPYSDDSLWHGALLSADSFWEFGERDDRTRALRLFTTLTTRYPNSSFVKQMASYLERLNAAKMPAEVDPSAIVLKSIRRDALAGAMRVTLELEGEAAYHDEEVSGQPRVFIDLQDTRPGENLRDLTQAFSDDLVRQIRVGRQPGMRTRVILDLSARAPHTVYALYNPYRVVIDFSRDLAATEGTKTIPVSTKDAKMGFTTKDTKESSEASRAMPPSAPAVNGRGGFSLSRQLGLGVARVVIDPGHGGHDPGAMTNGFSEAELVLDVAIRLERLLVKQPGVEVVMTRRANVFVPLEERTAIANREGADLFLSIHANASEDDRARGIETYFLNFAPNPAAEAIAARENAASVRTMRQLPDIVKAIALNNKIDESRDVASLVQTAMLDRLKRSNKNAKDLGVKQAPFMVLVGATMPSILAEISFLTNPQEAVLLRGSGYRQQIAEALFNGIMRYQRSLKAEAQTVASQ